ncbi:MAG TPA: CpsB/CapC family capsule biosynthesis tyrosine phosphatase [Bacteroidia bacterium]|jgi:protein-tyrosine phosphatase|nr:CpsB/CapC family capsule biosynthesis tyrosine phosphatase [Bacteroidia bacterium]
MAFFGLFNKKSSLPPADLSVLKVDMHSHFIPGIDDGAKNTDESLEMLEEMKNLGYKKVVTTPHIMSDGYRNTPEIILKGLERLRKRVKEAGIDIEVEAAAEYYFDYDFEKSIPQKNKLTFGNNYLLWEMSFMNKPENINEIIFEMIMNGYKPVLAHVERYPFWHNDYSVYEDLASRGTLLQLNINSIAGQYGGPTKKAAEWLIDHDMISFLGTDCHHMGHLETVRKACSEKYMHKVLASGKLLNSTL